MSIISKIFLNIIAVMLLQKVVGKTVPRIAIVGGGIGGTSCAYFLNKLFDSKASITLFEREIIGGRLNLINIDGNYYDSGGSVIHPRNKYMLDFVKLLGLSHRSHESSKFGIYDGEQFVFEESDWSILTISRLILRYGISLVHMKQMIKSMLNDFNNIYDAQDEGLAFTTVSGLLDYMNPKFRNMTQESLENQLDREGFPYILIDELVQSVMMVNYGQTTNISGFAGFVSLAGADPDVWAVEGGNKKVPEMLLQASAASVVNGNVMEISLLEDDTYELKYNESVPGGKLKGKKFDIIIIAAPLIKGSDNIVFKNFKKSFSSYESEFHRTVATFVQGNLKPSAFNAESVPEEIFTFNEKLIYNCIGRVWPVDGSKEKGKNVYKIFSQRPLMYEEIKSLFSDIEIVKSVDWLAYPHYVAPENLSPFMMYPGLYYINAIEASASAMEMSAIASKNIALLVSNLWNNTIDLVDTDKRIYKDEL